MFGRISQVQQISPPVPSAAAGIWYACWYDAIDRIAQLHDKIYPFVHFKKLIYPSGPHAPCSPGRASPIDDSVSGSIDVISAAALLDGSCVILSSL